MNTSIGRRVGARMMNRPHSDADDIVVGHILLIC